MNEKTLKELLFFTIDILNENKIKYWIDYGTLLGCVRDKSIISHDCDVDISMFEKDKDRLLKLKNCFSKYDFSLRPHGTVLIKPKRKTNLHLDILFWKCKDNILNRYKHIVNKNKGHEFPIDWVSPLKQAFFYDKVVSIPNNPKQFCEFRYGSTWQKPLTVSEFNSQFSD